MADINYMGQTLPAEEWQRILAQGRQQSAQQRMADANRRVGSIGATAGAMGGLRSAQAEQDAAMRALNAMAVGGQGQGGGDDPFDQVMEERERGFDLLEGRASTIEGDPRIQAALDVLQGMATGEQLPMGEDVQSAMLGRIADMNAGSEQAQLQALGRAQSGIGGSIYDPSMQAEQRALMGQRQLANQGAARDIMIDAAMANYDAQRGASNQLVGNQLSVYGATNPLAQQAANERFNTIYAAGEQASPVLPGNYQYGAPALPQQGGGGGSIFDAGWRQAAQNMRNSARNSQSDSQASYGYGQQQTGPIGMSGAASAGPPNTMRPAPADSGTPYGPSLPQAQGGLPTRAPALPAPGSQLPSSAPPIGGAPSPVMDPLRRPGQNVPQTPGPNSQADIDGLIGWLGRGKTGAPGTSGIGGLPGPEGPGPEQFRPAVMPEMPQAPRRVPVSGRRRNTQFRQAPGGRNDMGSGGY